MLVYQGPESQYEVATAGCFKTTLFPDTASTVYRQLLFGW